MMSRREEIASEILRQLGGANRLRAMIGANTFLHGEDNGNAWLSFKFPKPGHKSVNYCKVTLNGLDLYDVELGYIRMPDYKVVDSTSDLYNDMLKGYIEKATGLYLSL